jgi:hypothetical protein
MKTKCKCEQLEFQGFGRRKIIVKNDGKENSSDAGFLLLNKIEEKHNIVHRLAECFIDNRNQEKITHSLTALLTQRIFAICQGYEDLNDHDILREDPLLQYVCEKEKNMPVAGKSTLNRLELGKEADLKLGWRYSKIYWEDKMIEDLFCEIFLDSFKTAPKQLILDFDATDIPVHGDQQYKFFHGYYDHYCFLPLYVFCGDFPLAAKLRPSDIDGCLGTEEILERLVCKIRERFPDTQIIFRGDSGFCRDSIMSLCESLGISYVIGIAKNSKLKDLIFFQMIQASREYRKTGQSARVFTRFTYRTHDSWNRDREIVAKAEHLSKGENPRFIVTNIEQEKWSDQALYEELYCARGDMENRIKEQQLCLFADRTSTWWMSSNQLRLWFSAFAYIFFILLQDIIPEDRLEKRYMPSTMRLRLLKVSAVVRITVRNVWISLPESYPYWDVWIELSRGL